jgi:hypothetical protein
MAAGRSATSATAAPQALNAKDERLKWWLCERLRELCGIDDDGQIAEHVLSLNSAQQLYDYLAELLGEDLFASKEGGRFVEETMRRRGMRMADLLAARAAQQQQQRGGFGGLPVLEVGGGKSEAEMAHVRYLQRGRGMKITWVRGGRGGRNARGRGSAAAAATTAPAPGELRAKKNRRECGCAATDHLLFANCTACGRIACEVEGAGPCYYCGSFVAKERTFVSPDFERLMRESHAEEGERAPAEPAAEQRTADGLGRALEARDTLLARAKDATGRVFDDQSDYFRESNVWLSAEERDMARRKAAVDEAKATLSHARRGARLAISIDGQGGVEATVAAASDADLGLEYAEDYSRHGGARQPAAPAASHATRHFKNDTLQGRAKEVYEALLDALRKSHVAAADAAAAPREMARVQHDYETLDRRAAAALDADPRG